MYLHFGGCVRGIVANGFHLCWRENTQMFPDIYYLVAQCWLKFSFIALKQDMYRAVLLGGQALLHAEFDSLGAAAYLLL